MKVAELMEKLAALDPNMEVMVDGYEYGVQPPSDASVETILLNYHSPDDWGGPHSVAYGGDEAQFDKQVVFLISR